MGMLASQTLTGLQTLELTKMASERRHHCLGVNHKVQRFEIAIFPPPFFPGHGSNKSLRTGVRAKVPTEKYSEHMGASPRVQRDNTTVSPREANA